MTMSKERIFIPPGLHGRFEKLVEREAKELGTTEEDARRLVEIAVLTRGIAFLERALAADETLASGAAAPTTEELGVVLTGTKRKRR
jgi:hypothetical protein